MFPRHAIYNKYRYPKDSDSPLNGIYIKGLNDFVGKIASLDIIMVDPSHSMNKYAKLRLTTKKAKRKEIFTASDDEETITWVILDQLEPKLRLNFIGIVRKLKSRNGKDSYLATNMKLRLRIFDGSDQIHEEISNIIRDTNSSKAAEFMIASTSFEGSRGSDNKVVMIILFTKPLSVYEKELQLFNGVFKIQSYQPTEKYPCIKVSFEITPFLNNMPFLHLLCDLFRIKVNIDIPIIRGIPTSNISPTLYTPLTTVNITPEMNNGETEEGNDDPFMTPVVDLSTNEWEMKDIEDNDDYLSNQNVISDNYTQKPYRDSLEDARGLNDEPGLMETQFNNHDHEGASRENSIVSAEDVDRFLAFLDDKDHFVCDYSDPTGLDDNYMSNQNVISDNYTQKPYLNYMEDILGFDDGPGLMETQFNNHNEEGAPTFHSSVDVHSQLFHTKAPSQLTKEKKEIAEFNSEFNKHYNRMIMEDGGTHHL